MRTLETKQFRKDLKKILSQDQQKQFNTFKKELKHGKQRGKPLGPHYLREYKIQGKRVYYITGWGAAAFITASNKKQQQKTIKELRKLLPRLRARLKAIMTR